MLNQFCLIDRIPLPEPNGFLLQLLRRNGGLHECFHAGDNNPADALLQCRYRRQTSVFIFSRNTLYRRYKQFLGRKQHSCLRLLHGIDIVAKPFGFRFVSGYRQYRSALAQRNQQLCLMNLCNTSQGNGRNPICFCLFDAAVSCQSGKCLLKKSHDSLLSCSLIPSISIICCINSWHDPSDPVQSKLPHLLHGQMPAPFPAIRLPGICSAPSLPDHTPDWALHPHQF